MKIIAIAKKGQEFMYKPKTAHAVTPLKDFDLIKDTLNKLGFALNDGETWHEYEIDKYDKAYIYAADQKFILSKNGNLKRKHYAY